MNHLLADLRRLIDLNRQEKWVPVDQALEDLEAHAEALIPGLVDALDDGDDEVRLLAIELLNAAGSRAEGAVPALVKKVADPDRLVRVAAASVLAQFGPKAVDAVPLLEAWLDDDNEYIRLVAATTILALDPRTSGPVLSRVKKGLYSKNPVVRSLAEDFFEQRRATITESAKAKMADLRPTDRVRLLLRVNDVHLWPQEEARLHELGCTFYLQTSFVAIVEIPVERVEEIAKLPSVKEIR